MRLVRVVKSMRERRARRKDRRSFPPIVPDARSEDGEKLPTSIVSCLEQVIGMKWIVMPGRMLLKSSVMVAWDIEGRIPQFGPVVRKDGKESMV